MNVVRSRFAAWLIPLALGVAGSAAATPYEIDASHSSVGFAVQHMMMSKVTGVFTKYRGTVDLNEKEPTKSTAELVVDTSSIDTREPKRDTHLKSPDFFDVAKYPEMTFKSTKVVAGKGANKFLVHGDLTIRGVTKPVVLDAQVAPKELKDPYGNLKRGATATTKISRKDYGLLWNAPIEAGGVLVGDEVTINIELELQKKKDEGTAPAAVVPPPTTTQKAQNVAQPKK